MHQQLAAPNLLEKKDHQRVALNLATEFGDPVLDLDALDWQKFPINSSTKQLIEQHCALPLYQRGNRLFLALAHPTNHQAMEAFQFHTGFNIHTVIVEENKLLKVINKVLDNKALFAENPSIVNLLDEILFDAIDSQASDIHFEPHQKQCRIRFRNDGILSEYTWQTNATAIKLITRLKILSQLDIAERRLPQDGHFKLPLSSEKMMDMRVSLCPTLHGEKAVVRILDPSKLQMGIELLGMEENQKSTFQQGIRCPQGMIIVTGPTGSGKTVTLYSALHALNSPAVNISTIEDPIEIQLPGINQVNIHPKIGLTFAHALRAFLRQDPDIIMVGEIRDKETAEIAIQAAQTGHLVLSTMHTNSAQETLSRLLNLGIPSYHLSSLNLLIVAQRLVRKLCSFCKKEKIHDKSLLLSLGFYREENDNSCLYTAQGCQHCHQGYKGRIGIFEILLPTKEGNEKITLSLREAGFVKVKAGLTSLEEVLRVTG